MKSGNGCSRMVASSSFPSSCWGEYAIQVAEMSSGTPTSTRNLIACIYCTKLYSCYWIITISWCRNLMGEGFSVAMDDPSAPNSPLCKVEMKPWVAWKKQGKKAMVLAGKKVEIMWDMATAKYSPAAGPEPQESFYLAVVVHGQMLLLLGDKKEQAYDATKAKTAMLDPILLSRKEHIFGRKYYSTKAQLMEGGRSHEIWIEYCRGGGGVREPRLRVKVDRQIVLHVKHLTWKFRGNEMILVDGLAVELFWDVHNWLFNPDHRGNAVFMFQTYFPSSNLKTCSYGEQEPFSKEPLKRRDSVQLAGFSLLLHAWRSE